jgi:hypothetical protein
MADDNDDEAYLIMPSNLTRKVTLPETVWVKIGDDGGLEIIRWDIIEMYASEYDSNVRNRTQTHVLCKLLVLVRAETRKECAEKK